MARSDKSDETKRLNREKLSTIQDSSTRSRILLEMLG